MDRKQFISELRERLMCLPYDERDKAISFYEEYFDDAGKENEEKVIKELGSIEKIAREIIENSSSDLDAVSKNKFSQNNPVFDNKNITGSNIRYDNITNYNENASYNNNYNNTAGNNKSKLKPLWIVLAVIGAIFVLPVAIGIVGFIIGLIGLIIGLTFSSIGFAVSLILGIASIPVTGIAFVGRIFFLLGRGILGVVVLILIIIGIIYFIKKVSTYIKNRNMNK